MRLHWARATRASAARREATLTMTEGVMSSLRAQLLRDANERAAFAFLGKRERDGALELLVHRLALPADADYRQQHGAVVEPTPAYVLETLAAFAAGDSIGYLHAHSHPFCNDASFSSIDDRYLPGEIESIGAYLRSAADDRTFVYVRLVWGRSEAGFTAEVYDARGSFVATVTRLRVVGPSGTRVIVAHGADRRGGGSPAEDVVEARLDRNVRWLGRDGQATIRRTSLAIVGCGGIGSEVTVMARGLGFGRIVLVDADTVEESNLNRLLGARRADIGRPKVQVLEREILDVDPGASVRTVPTTASSEEARAALEAADAIVCGLDNAGARLDVQVLAARHLRPLLDMGSGIVLRPGTREVQHMGAQAALYVPGGPCIACQGVIDPARVISPEHAALRRRLGYIEGTDETPPSVVTLNSIIAGVGMEMLVKHITGFAPAPTFARYDALENRLDVLPFARRAACAICGEQGVEGLGQEWARPSLPATGAEDVMAKESADAASA